MGKRRGGIQLKTREDLVRMRASCRIAAQVRETVARCVRPGVTTGELSDYAAELMRGFGAESAFYGYRGYPGQICVSLNEEVVHGIPGKRRVELGDVVSLDIGVKFEQYIGDTATTVMVGVTNPRVVSLVAATRRALAAAIGAARAGSRVSDISHAVESMVEQAGFSVVRDLVGHGVGRQLHEEPQVPNFGEPGRGPRLRSGMTLALEPMVNMGGGEVDVMTDGWTVQTRDRLPSAHFEHTVAVGEEGAEVLTAVEGGMEGF